MKWWWDLLRQQRDELLAASDKTQLSDFPIKTELRARYKEYRQYLRDLPTLYSEDTIKQAKVKSFDEWLEWKRGGAY